MYYSVLFLISMWDGQREGNAYRHEIGEKSHCGEVKCVSDEGERDSGQGKMKMKRC